ncbi:MAG TPA: pyridoxal phosphate-dependent aminotransferase, partial [Anaerolineales bacterium]|nr:pyridoxal phosphate-dependent aminotransferase [Anaerolineales bacterium]
RAQALEAAGRDIIHFEIGQPDFETFENIREAGRQAIADGQTRYTPPAGMPALRAAIARAAGSQRGLHVDPGQVVVSPGAKPNLFFAALALIEPGDPVLYPDPGFPTYRAMIELAGGTPVPVPLHEQDDFSFDLRAFDRLIQPGTRLIILNSPGNPTGGVLPPAALEHIAAVAVKYDCWVLSDEIYAGLVYDGARAVSIASLPGMQQRTIIVDGFSKTYAMTGWRLGFGIMPADLASRLDLLLTHSVGSTAHFTQWAGIEALTGSQEPARRMLREYQQRRDLIVEGLRAIPGVTCRTPAGAFYVFPNVKAFGRTSSEITDLLLEQAGVAVLPGSAFGQYGEGYLRLSYATSSRQITAGLQRMRQALEGLGPVA